MTDGSDIHADAPWDDLELEALAAYDALAPRPGHDTDADDRFADAVLARLAAEDPTDPGDHPATNGRAWPVREGKGQWPRVIALAAMLAAIIGSGVAVATIESDRALGRPGGPTVSQMLPPPVAAREKAKHMATPMEVLADPFPARPSPGPLPATLGAQLDAYLESYGEYYGPAFRFHGVVSVSRGGETVVVARGRMHAGDGAPPHDASSRFLLGSLSQQLVAVAAMRMVERGELSLDATVGEVLPDYAGPGRVVTLEQLLSHASGIPNLTDGRGWPSVRGKELGPLQLREFFEHADLEFEPGTRFDPSNSNYVLVGQMLAARAGDTLDAVMAREVFEPAGMDHTTIGDRPLGEVADGQEFDEREFLKSAVFVHTRAMGGAGGIVSDVEDLRRFDRALRDGVLLDEQTRREMFTPRHERYALGWIVDETLGQPSVAHPGGVDGNNHQLLRLADGTTIIVLANTEVVDARDVGAAVAALAMGSEPERHVEYVETSAPAHRLLHYAGRYGITEASRAAYQKAVDEDRLALLDDVRVYVDGGVLWFEVAGYGRKWMHPKGGDSFFFKDRAAGRAEFSGREADGRPAYLEIREGRARFILERREMPVDDDPVHAVRP